MDNKRQSVRRRVFYYLEVEDVEHGTMLGRLGDISHDGLMILSSNPLPLEKVYGIAVHLPDTPAFSGKKLELSVETRWVRPDYNPEILCIGCRLLEAPLDKEYVLRQLIEYYGFSDGYKVFRQPEQSV